MGSAVNRGAYILKTSFYPQITQIDADFKRVADGYQITLSRTSRNQKCRVDKARSAYPPIRRDNPLVETPRFFHPTLACYLIPNNPLARHSRAGGNPAKQTRREADKTIVFGSLRENYSINWIPACAGMTQFVANELFGLICGNLRNLRTTGFSRFIVPMLRVGAPSA
ncbi:MAG: hypothetical protein WAW10_12275 [Gallionella sp.]